MSAASDDRRCSVSTNVHTAQALAAVAADDDHAIRSSIGQASEVGHLAHHRGGRPSTAT
jgi:hypothetical protein